MKTMKTIRVSEEVLNEIAKQGMFGEKEDDVLRRVFNLRPKRRSGKRGKRIATNRMEARIVDGSKLLVEFKDGTSRTWELPDRNDKPAIRLVRQDAFNFAEQRGATPGQVAAVSKALTDHGWYVRRSSQ